MNRQLNSKIEDLTERMTVIALLLFVFFACVFLILSGVYGIGLLWHLIF